MICRLKNLFLYFSIIFFISGVSFFVAYNWDNMGNILKLSIPLSLITAGIGGWFLWQKKEIYRKISLFFASFFIGTLFALFGQIYQTGADVYNLFLNWGLFLIIFSYAESFYPLWTLNIVVLATGISLFTRLQWGTVTMFYAGALLIYSAFLIYCFFVKRRGVAIKNWFFYLLATASTLLMNTGIGSYIFKNSYMFGNKNHTQNGAAAFSIYIIFLLSLFFLGEKVMKKQGLNILGIISATSFLSNLGYMYMDRSRGGMTLYTFFNICLFIGAIGLINKKYISTQSQRVVINIFKIYLIFYIIALVSLLIPLLGFGEIAFPILGILFLALSIYLPIKLKFKEDKSEIVILISGILLILFYLYKTLKFGQLPCFLIGMGIYGIFWYFRHSKALDFLLIPIFIGGLLFISKDLGVREITPILCLPLLAVLFSLWGAQQEHFRIKRIIRGGEITLMLSGIFFYGGIFSVKIRSEILSWGVLSLSLLILYRIFQGESKYKFFAIALLMSGANYFFLNVWSINLAIMLLLLYIYREEKYMLGVATLFFAGQISFYYYKMERTLLEKSYIMLKNSLILFTGFFLLRGEK